MGVDEIINFVYMHYKTATKNDTLFWKEMKEKPMPDKVLAMYNAVIDGPLANDVFNNMMKKDKPSFHFTSAANPIFSASHWWQLLKGMDKYENIKREYSDDFMTYGKMKLNLHSKRMDNILNVFPNHYDYLTEWYENW